MNVQESGVVRRVLEDAGFEETDQESSADVLLMMTCSVRGHAEQRALGRLGTFRSLRAARQGRVVAVLGCMAQRFGEVLVSEHRADIVVGPDEYLRLPELIREAGSGRTGLVAIRQTSECYDSVEPNPDNPVTAFVTVMRGCDNYCSYCIVPYVKGRERSRPHDRVVAEARTLAASGTRDLTLLGQNVLAYRDDGHDFARLLDDVARAVPGVRIRFLTSHPRDMDLRLLETMAGLGNVCPSLHLPLQSGSDRILAAMNRGYTCSDYLAKIELCRKILPEVSLSTDVLVGFPSETEPDFLATLDVIRRVRFDFAYMFRYSARPGTKAGEMSPKVSEAEAGRRLSRLIDAQNRVTAEKAQAMLNRDCELLIEGPSPRRDGFLGRTATNKTVVVRGRVKPGDTVHCRVTRIDGWTPVATIVPPPAGRKQQAE
jgi:tRNA-2-methylthio-N6-dimethylallyladenosine synthase